MGKNIYFASDFHLGLDGDGRSAAREESVVRWLESIAHDAAEIYLVGDIFDFWFEYSHVIPKGYSRFLATIAQLRREGIPISFFTGNHDMWMFDYFEKEYGIPVFREPVEREFSGKHFIIGHGDGLGPGDHRYKMLKKVFANPACQWAFGWLHPNVGMGIARFWSKKSRMANKDAEHFLGPDKEWLVQYCEDYIKEHNAPDYFIFGHRHLPIDYTLSNGVTRYVNLGEWVYSRSYGVFDGTTLELRFFENPDGKIFP